MRASSIFLIFIIVLTMVGCSGEQGSKAKDPAKDPAKKQHSQPEKTHAPTGSISSNKQETTEETTSGGFETTGETTGDLETNTKGNGQGSKSKVDKKSGLLLSDTLVAGAEDRTNGPLVKHRVVSYYGHPFSAQMGILGEYQPDEMISHLKEQTKAYTKADPGRPAIPAIELIASVAQPAPGPDGLYLTRTPTNVIEKYAQLAKKNDCLLLLDVQIGYSSIADEIEALRPFLERDYVHLAIDPEYDMKPGQIPGQEFGNSSGQEIMAAAHTLSDIVKKKDLPPKILVIHQFRYDMISDKQAIKPVPNVEMVLHADGYGVPADKTEKYKLLVHDEPIQYGGFKLFYQQDVPLLTPKQVLTLNPKPAVISYQ
jgi:hypothetical protein